MMQVVLLQLQHMGPTSLSPPLAFCCCKALICSLDRHMEVEQNSMLCTTGKYLQ